MHIILFVYRKLQRKLKGWLLEVHRRELLEHINGGEKLLLEGKINLCFPKNLTLGHNVYIGADAYLNCLGGITIGDHTVISRRVTIYSYNHNFKRACTLPFDDENLKRPVHIGRYVWVGMNVTITPGTTIGDGAVIGMGTVVCGHIPDNAIVVGAKMRIVGFRDKEKTRKLVQQERFYKGYWKQGY